MCEHQEVLTFGVNDGNIVWCSHCGALKVGATIKHVDIERKPRDKHGFTNPLLVTSSNNEPPK